MKRIANETPVVDLLPASPKPKADPTIAQRIDRIEQRLRLGWYMPPSRGKL